ncbi:MAG: sigma-54-dependent Fis family transcriptional regulator [Spirochaetales bacterium]|nr:sigma-54-dependent Fis family transcriptional regulator [Spirochaetales bacterium]
MQTILLSSGYAEQTITTLSKHWKVLDIPQHDEALEYLKNCPRLPDAVAIGFVPSIKMKDNPQSDHDYPSELPAQAMLQEVLNLDSDLPVIISAGESHPRAIVELVKQGAFGYVVEPRDKKNLAALEQYNQELEMVLNQAVKWRLTILENRRLKQTLDQQSGKPKLIACSAVMNRVKELVTKVASTPATVLVSGESGTGKELIARLIHNESNRADKPFVAINCGAISETLLPSELFGHVKGSFTGAESHNLGLIRQAGVGTLFLDEIGALSPGFQVILLRVLEERIARPVGGQTEYPVKCRFIAAGSSDLEQLVETNKFREDLYYRLYVFHIEMPPLRRRREDIPLLANFFLNQITQEYDRSIGGFEPAAMELLENYRWPGNIRELRNVIERAVVLCETHRITPIDFVGYLKSRSIAMNIGIDQSYQEAMQKFENKLVRSALEQSKGNLALAARILQMKRTTLTYRIKRLKEI